MFSTPSACALSAVMAALASSDSSVSATLLAPRSGEAPEDKTVANTFECQCTLELTAALSSEDEIAARSVLLNHAAHGPFPIVRSCDDKTDYLPECDFALQAKQVSIRDITFGKQELVLDLVLSQPNMYVCDYQEEDYQHPKCSALFSADDKAPEVILHAGANGQGSVCKSFEKTELWPVDGSDGKNLVNKVTCGVQQTTTPAPKPETTAPYNALGCNCEFTFKEEEEAAAEAEPKKVIGSFSPLTYKNGSKIDYRAWLVDSNEDKHNMSKFSLNQDGSVSFAFPQLPLANAFSSGSTPIVPSQSFIVDVAPLEGNTMIMIGNKDDSKNFEMDIQDRTPVSFCNDEENDLKCQLNYTFATAAVDIQSLIVLPKMSMISLQVSTTVEFYICKVDKFNPQPGVTCFHIDSALGFSAESSQVGDQRLCQDMSKSWADIVPASTTIECAKAGSN